MLSPHDSQIVTVILESISGFAGKGSRQAVGYAGSNYDEQDSAFPRDKKFEGHSNMKGTDDKKKSFERKKAGKGENNTLQQDYITNL